MKLLRRIFKTRRSKKALDMGKYTNSFERSVRDHFEKLGDHVRLLEDGQDFPVVYTHKKIKDKRFRLDSANLCLEYGSSFKEDYRTIRLLDVFQIEPWNAEFFDSVMRYKSRYMLPGLQRKQCLTLVTKADSFNLVVLGKEERNWINWFTEVLRIVKEAQLEHQNDCWLWNLFQNADADLSGTLDFNECRKLVKHLNIESSSNLVQHIFNIANTDNRTRNSIQVLDGEEFLIFVHLLAKRPELETLYMKYCNSKGLVIKAKELKHLFSAEQKVEVTLKDAEKMIQKFEKSPSKEEGALTFIGFTALLNSDLFHIMKPEHRTVYQDMSKPLAHYFIASSHNTYLTGNQLTSNSSINAYVNALEAGCRCLELDLWDGPDGEPIIKHGYTVTSPISVQNVLHAIKTHAFSKSPFPVILSLENHLSQQQEVKFVALVRDILGDSIYAPPVDEHKVLPSPDRLKYKILLKASKPDQEIEVFEHTSSSKTSNIKYENLSDFVFLQSVRHFEGECREIVSLSENRARDMATLGAKNCVQFTQKQLCRIYPKGLRQDSSNLNPMTFWNAGCQIVTFNYQTIDQPMMLNFGKFQQNGSCGYVLKPEPLLVEANGADSTRKAKLIVTIRVISGQNLPRITWPLKDVTSPYVKISVTGRDEFKFETRTVAHDGFHPIWNETVTFELDHPQFDYLLVTVKHSALVDQQIAWYCLPVASLGGGYRHIPLMDSHKRPIAMASIFVHVTISTSTDQS